MMSFARGAALTLALLGCSASTTQPEVARVLNTGPSCGPEFAEILRRFQEADANNAWNEGTCGAFQQDFEPFFDDDEAGSVARFNAATAALRCDDKKGAMELLTGALKREPGFARARWLLATTDATLTPDSRISELERAATDASFNDPVILLALGRAQIARRNAVPDDDGPNDLERAAKNFRRALAVDDNFAPAISELALTLMMSARRTTRGVDLTRSPDSSHGTIDKQTLELVHLMASQGLRRHPAYAPLYNTLGLALFELGDSSGAIAAFNKARQLEPSFLDAHLNAAAVNLSFRGFERAEEAFRTALLLREDYDTLLGLALALRGRADEVVGQPALAAERLEAAATVLEKAKELAPTRPEAHFNHAVLLEIYGDRMGKDRGPRQAMSQYERFVELAKDDARFKQDVEAVTATPTKPDSECLGERAKSDRACARGRLFDLKQIVDESGS